MPSEPLVIHASNTRTRIPYQLIQPTDDGDTTAAVVSEGETIEFYITDCSGKVIVEQTTDGVEEDDEDRSKGTIKIPSGLQAGNTYYLYVVVTNEDEETDHFPVCGGYPVKVCGDGKGS